MARPKFYEICLVESCNETEKLRKGLCTKHYEQMRRNGVITERTHRDPNEIIEKKNYYEIVLTDPKGVEKGRAIIDKEDLSLIKPYRWNLLNTGYVSNHSIGCMHRLITGAKDEDYVDHKKTGFLSRRDNRKKNLRLCTQSQNNANTVISSRNTSGYKGVYWSKHRKKWIASIRLNGIKKNLGGFIDIKDAARAYVKAAKEHHKEFFNPNTRR